MTNERIKEILEKQLELLSEYSECCDSTALSQITDSMVAIVNLLREFSF